MNDAPGMKRGFRALELLLAFAVLGSLGMFAATRQDTAAESQPDRLAVVWTSGDADVAHRMCFMYTHAAKRAGWFDEVRLIVWGPSARLLAGDKDLQAKVAAMQESGIVVQACVACADSFGVSEKLRALNIEVKGMGRPLSDLIKSDWEVLTF
jgi:hypothetical protein